MLEATEDLDEAQSWAHSALGVNNAAKYFMGAENFVAAYKNENSFSFIVQGEPFYGQMYGEGAFQDERCSDIAVAGFKPELIGNLQPRGAGSGRSQAGGIQAPAAGGGRQQARPDRSTGRG